MELHELIGLTNYEHSDKVSKISKMMAEEAGYSEREAGIVRQAALFHDIGKNAIPAEIINKPGKLTGDEYAMVKQHTEIGYRQIMDAIQILELAAIIARQHHERWDGKGYVGNVSGEEIHPYARLVSVADVFEALVSRRVYKPAWDMNEAFQYMCDNAGKQFDGEFVDVLLQISGKVAQMYR